MLRRYARMTATAAIMFPAILIFLLHGQILRLLVRDPKERLSALCENVSAYSRFALWVMRIDVDASWNAFAATGNALYVSNHMSYLDMMILASIEPLVFVTSVDMGEVFFLGTMAETGGSIFIERRNRERVEQDISQIDEKLAWGFNIVLFPEGTSSNGERVLPFKKSLLVAAARAGRPIQPLTLKYTRVDGEPFSPKNRDSVCWYGDMGFVGHFLNVMSLSSVSVQVYFHERVRTSPSDTRDQIANQAFQPIASLYGEPLAAGPLNIGTFAVIKGNAQA